MSERNWAGNLAFAAAEVRHPTDVAAVQAIVADAARCGRGVHAAGSRHSFSDVADTTGELVLMGGLDRIVEIDGAASTVTVEAGIRYGELSAALHRAGWALHNLPSLPHITVAGAVATGTHGSGTTNGNLATAVRGIEMVTSDGSLVRITDDDPRFAGVVVNLGALGIVVRLTLAIGPTFDVAQTVYRDLPFDVALAELDLIMGAAYSVSLFTDYQGEAFEQVWCKRRIGDDEPAPSDFWGAAPAAEVLHPVPGVSAESCTEQRGTVGPWCDRLAHFRLGFQPSSGDELQSEFFVPLANGAEAVRAVRALREQLAPVLKVSEIRTVAADDRWLSGAFDRDTLALHFTWIPDPARVEALLPTLEAALIDFDARPHWGKLTTLAPDVIRQRFPRWPDWAALVDELDPEQCFRNRYVDALMQ